MELSATEIEDLLKKKKKFLDVCTCSDNTCVGPTVFLFLGTQNTDEGHSRV